MTTQPTTKDRVRHWNIKLRRSGIIHTKAVVVEGANAADPTQKVLDLLVTEGRGQYTNTIG